MTRDFRWISKRLLKKGRRSGKSGGMQVTHFEEDVHLYIGKNNVDWANSIPLRDWRHLPDTPTPRGFQKPFAMSIQKARIPADQSNSVLANCLAHLGKKPGPPVGFGFLSGWKIHCDLVASLANANHAAGDLPYAKASPLQAPERVALFVREVLDFGLLHLADTFWRFSLPTLSVEFPSSFGHALASFTQRIITCSAKIPERDV